MFYVVGFRASLCQQPAYRKEHQMIDGYGPTFTDLYVFYDRATCSWKMCQGSLLPMEATPSPTWSEIWPRHGMTVNGRLFRLEMSEHPIYESASGLSVPTPMASDASGTGRMNANGNVKKWGGVNSLVGMAQTGMWPTPSAEKITESGELIDVNGNSWTGRGKPHSAKTGKPLQTALTDAVKHWPTPTASDWKGSGPTVIRKDGKDRRQDRLDYAVEQDPESWPTPDTRGFTNDGSLATLKDKASSREEFSAMAYRAGRAKKEKVWPPPRSQDAKHAVPTAWEMQTDHAGTKDSLRVHIAKERESSGHPSPVSGSLNPNWVEWLMGYPVGWTDLED